MDEPITGAEPVRDTGIHPRKIRRRSAGTRDSPLICRILQIANFRKMPDTWKRAGAFEERAISGNQWAIEFHGECQERGVVKRKVKLFADSRCAL